MTRPLFVPALVLALLTALLLGGALATGAVPIFRDQLVLSIPLRFAAWSSLRTGSVPLWSDDLFLGAPFLASYQSQVFYPPALAGALLPFAPAIVLLLALHVFAGALGTARYLRRIDGLGPAEATLGAVVFGFGGFVMSLLSLANQLSAVAWLPWVLDAAESFWSSGRARHWLALVAFLLLQGLAGAPETWLLTMALAAALCARRRRASRAPARAVALGALAVALAAGLAAFQLLPTLEYASTTDRATGLTLATVTEESLDPRSLWQLLLPHTFSDGAPNFLPEGRIPLFWSLYLGIATLGLIVAGAAGQRFWIGALVLSALLAMGSATPIVPLAFSLAPRAIGIFRFPSKLLVVAHFACALLAARGTARIRDDPRARFRALAASSTIAVAAAAIALAGRGAPSGLLALLRFEIPGPLSAEATRFLAAGMALLGARAAALAVLTAGLLLLAHRERIAPSLLGCALVALVSFDLLAIHRPAQVFGDWSELSRIGAARTRPGERVFHYAGEPGSGLERWSGGLRPGERVEPRARALWASLVPDAPMVYGAGAVSGSDGFVTRAQREVFTVLARSAPAAGVRLLSAFGVDRMIGTVPLDGPGLTPVPVAQGAAAPFEYALVERTPRIYLAGHVERVDDASAALERIASGPFRAGRDAFVAGEAPTITDGAGAIDRVVRAPGLLSIEARVERTVLCVVSDTWYPGWEATVDGAPVALHVANGVVRGVVVPPGRHLIEVRYRSRPFALGAVLSLASLLATLAVATGLARYGGFA